MSVREKLALGRCNVALGTLALALLIALGLAAPAAAAPCCSSCDGWPEEPPPVLDWCWTHCILCNGGGYECGGANGSCQPGWECVNGYCTRIGLAPAGPDFGQPVIVGVEPRCPGESAGPDRDRPAAAAEVEEVAAG